MKTLESIRVLNELQRVFQTSLDDAAIGDADAIDAQQDNQRVVEALESAVLALGEKFTRECPSPLKIEDVVSKFHRQVVWCVNNIEGRSCWATVWVTNGYNSTAGSYTLVTLRDVGGSMITEISIRKGCIPRDKRGRKVAGNYIFYATKPVNEKEVF